MGKLGARGTGGARGRLKLLLAIALVEALAASGTLGYRWLTASTPVSVSQALERYREEVRATAGASTRAPSGPTAPSSRWSPRPTAAQPSTSPSTARPSPTASPSTGFWTHAPEPGVYTYATDGTETADGLTRTLPSQSQRIVTIVNAQTWDNHHIYSDQHEEWFRLAISSRGVVCPTYRMKISYGPFSQDQTIVFDPPLRFAAFPLKVGQRWQETFSGPTYGSYTGKTFERTSIRIGDETVEAWGVEVQMTMQGTVTGTVTFRLWMSPKYRLPVKEQYDESERMNGQTYRENLTNTLLSTTPQR